MRLRTSASLTTGIAALGLVGCIGSVKNVIPLGGYSTVDYEELQAAKSDLCAQIRVRVDALAQDSCLGIKPEPLALEHATARLIADPNVSFNDDGTLKNSVKISYEDEDGLLLTIFTLGICHLVDSEVEFPATVVNGYDPTTFARSLSRARAAGVRVSKNPPRGLRLRIWGNSVKMTFGSQRFREEDVNRVVDATQPFLPGLDGKLLIGEPQAVADRLDAAISSVASGTRSLAAMNWSSAEQPIIRAAIASMNSGVNVLAMARLLPTPEARVNRGVEGVALVRSGMTAALDGRLGASIQGDDVVHFAAATKAVEDGLVRYLHEYVRAPDGRNVIVFSSNPSEVLGALDAAVRGAQESDEAERLLRDIASTSLAEKEGEIIKKRERLRSVVDLLRLIQTELSTGPNDKHIMASREQVLARIRAMRALLGEGGL